MINFNVTKLLQLVLDWFCLMLAKCKILYDKVLQYNNMYAVCSIREYKSNVAET